MVRSPKTGRKLDSERVEKGTKLLQAVVRWGQDTLSGRKHTSDDGEANGE